MTKVTETEIPGEPRPHEINPEARTTIRTELARKVLEPTNYSSH